MNLYCAFCLEREPDDPLIATTVVQGTAVCDKHRLSTGWMTIPAPTTVHWPWATPPEQDPGSTNGG